MMMKVYKVVLKSGRKFYVESYEDYQRIFSRYCKRYGQELAAVYQEYGISSIEDIKRKGDK
jgi:uncharacterized protein YcgL (UPF0745 family)